MLADRAIFACSVVLAAVYFYATAQIPALDIGDPLGPKAFPRLLGAGLLIAAALLLVEMIKAGRTAPAAARERTSHRHLWIIAGVTGWTALYFACFEPAGYLLSTAVYLLGLTGWLHRRGLADVLTSVLFSLGTYLLFVKVLGVTLAKGVLGF